MAALLTASVVLAACGSTATGGSGTGAVTTTVELAAPAPAGFTPVKLRVVSPDGTVVERCVLLADSDLRRQQGLMGVSDPDLGGIGAMVFRFDHDTTTGFWMKDTLVPLSIAFAEASGAVLSTADMEPCPPGADPCPVTYAAGPYRLAVEVPHGQLAAFGLVPGGQLAVSPGDGCTPQAT